MSLIKNIIVTGGAGFIGLNFVKLIHAKTNWNIFVIDSLTYAADKQALPILDSLKPRVKFIKCNINDLESSTIKSLQIDTIVNFAAESHVDNSIINPDIFIKTNINGVLNLLNLTRVHNLRFHQVSTDEVYGELELNKPHKKFKINSPINPSSPYSASKASADLLVQAFTRTYKINATISRCSNNYGPHQQTEKLIPKIINNLINHEKFPIYGDGKNVRDWIFVDDHNEAILLILQKTQNGVFNIGANNEYNNLAIAKLICKQFNLNLNDWTQFVTDRLGHDRRYAINWKSMKQIGWAPKIKFEDGLKITIDFYKNLI